jgi:hypothetical protein
MILQDDGTGFGTPLAKNIVWQVAESVEVGAGAHVEGVFLVKTFVAFGTGASLILAQTAATLDQATITQPTI